MKHQSPVFRILGAGLPALLVASLALMLSMPAFAGGSSCGDPGAGDCLQSNGTPACDSQTCCEAVGAQDSFCTETDWDGLCANQALEICEPIVDDVVPNEGPDTGGTQVTLFGELFGGPDPDVTSVTIGGEPCGNLSLISNTELTCETPAGSVGAADVTLVNDTENLETNEGTLAGGYTYTEGEDPEEPPAPLAVPVMNSVAMGIAVLLFLIAGLIINARLRHN